MSFTAQELNSIKEVLFGNQKQANVHNDAVASIIAKEIAKTNHSNFLENSFVAGVAIMEYLEAFRVKPADTIDYVALLILGRDGYCVHQQYGSAMFITPNQDPETDKIRHIATPMQSTDDVLFSDNLLVPMTWVRECMNVLYGKQQQGKSINDAVCRIVLSEILPPSVLQSQEPDRRTIINAIEKHITETIANGNVDDIASNLILGPEEAKGLADSNSVVDCVEDSETGRCTFMLNPFANVAEAEEEYRKAVANATNTDDNTDASTFTHTSMMDHALQLKNNILAKSGTNALTQFQGNDWALALYYAKCYFKDEGFVTADGDLLAEAEKVKDAVLFCAPSGFLGEFENNEWAAALYYAEEYYKFK